MRYPEKKYIPYIDSNIINSNNIYAKNLLYNTGNQIISGNKTFIGDQMFSGNINVSGTGIFSNLNLNSISGLNISGVDIYITDGTVYSNQQIYSSNLVYNTGNQNIAGIKNFYHTPTINGDGILSSGQDIIGGDLTGDLLSSTVNKLQGYPLSINSPSAGQTLIYNGETWVPGANANGGGGGGGKVYYFNFANNSGIAPSGGLPTTGFSALSLLGREYSIGSGQFNSPDLTPKDEYHLVSHFVTASGDPGITNIPAGLWDFNIWAKTDSTIATQTQMKAVVNIYDPINSAYRYVNQSDDVYLYDTITPAQYILNVSMPQTGIQSYERIYVQLFGKKTTNPAKTITFYFDSYRPSHVHTTIPSIAGSGVVKVIDGAYQTPASTIVDIDVNASANIQQSKIQNLTTDLGNLYPRSNPSGYVSASRGIVFTTGNQIISGNKTFINNIEVQGTGIFNSLDLSNISEFQFSGVNINIIDSVVGGSNSLTLDFNSGVYFSDKKTFGLVPEIINVGSNFNISGNFNSRMILANNSSQITGLIISGNATGFNASIIQIGAGQIQITGSGVGVSINSYNNQYKTAGQFATISLLHTGNNGYIMYGNTAL